MWCDSILIYSVYKFLFSYIIKKDVYHRSKLFVIIVDIVIIVDN